MNKFFLYAGAVFSLAGLMQGANADIPLKDATDVLGTWRLESVAPGIDKPKIEENRTWEFRGDGTIVTSGFNRHFKTDDRHEWSYKIVDGKISADDPGRPGRTIEYSLYEKNGDSMILKGGIEGFYFFKKQ